MFAVGMPELMITLIFGLFWGVPVAAAVWALVTLNRIRAGQQAIDVRLATIERLTQGRQPG
jgi:hypothetical protein